MVKSQFSYVLQMGASKEWKLCSSPLLLRTDEVTAFVVAPNPAID
jgi:hypothetical protein